MTKGKLIAGGLVLFALLFGIALWAALVHGHYQRVNGLTQVDVRGRALAVSAYEGLDAPGLPLKLRGCFQLADVSALLAAAPPAPKAQPLSTPGWFTCYDAARLGADLASGLAVAVLAAEKEQGFFDRIIAVYPDGRAFMWRQLNPEFVK